MTDIVLFHSVLGVCPGVSEAADRLRTEGHDVVVVDQYGRVFDDYDEASEFAESIAYRDGAGSNDQNLWMAPGEVTRRGAPSRG